MCVIAVYFHMCLDTSGQHLVKIKKDSAINDGMIEC